MIKSAAQLKISLAILVYIWFPQITGEKFCDFFSTTATEGNSMIFSLQSQREILLFFHCSDRGKFCVFFFFSPLQRRREILWFFSSLHKRGKFCDFFHYSDRGKFCDFFHYSDKGKFCDFFTTATEGILWFFALQRQGNSVMFFTTATELQHLMAGQTSHSPLLAYIC